MPVPQKFIREEHLVKLLMQRLGISVSEYLDPNAGAKQEAGVDVITTTTSGRIGIQVTELDTGTVPGRSRGEEKKAAQAGKEVNNGVYSTWAQNDSPEVLKAIERSINRKSLMTSSSDFKEVWLLLSCGVPELGTVGSTFVMTPWLDTEALNSATLGQLSKSKYDYVFLHPVIGMKKALYQWSPKAGSWEKTVQPEASGTQGPSFFDVIEDQEWLNDPEGKCDQEIAKALQEIREGKL